MAEVRHSLGKDEPRYGSSRRGVVSYRSGRSRTRTCDLTDVNRAL
jgi:hypothetical protein